MMWNQEDNVFRKRNSKNTLTNEGPFIYDNVLPAEGFLENNSQQGKKNSMTTDFNAACEAKKTSQMATATIGWYHQDNQRLQYYLCLTCLTILSFVTRWYKISAGNFVL